MAILASLDHGVNSIDGLFILPYRRLRYYKKLYSKLLQSTQPGRSDHQHLSAANDKIVELMSACVASQQHSVLDDDDNDQQEDYDEEEEQHEEEQEEPEEGAAASPTKQPVEEEVVAFPPLPKPPPLSQHQSFASDAERKSFRASVDEMPPPPPLRSPTKSDQQFADASRTSSFAASSVSHPASLAGTASSDQRSSGNQNTTNNTFNSMGSSSSNTQQSSFTSLSQSFHSMALSSAEELENKLNTSKTLDVFSLSPKHCRLQMNPPGMPFTRTIRQSGDVAMSFRLSDTSLRQRQARLSPEVESQLDTEVHTSRARIVLLTDLFLLCEHADERSSDPDAMLLLFPPLAGKHLRAVPNEQDPEGREFEILIMQRETIGIRCASRDERDRWLMQFAECAAFVPPPSSFTFSLPSSSEKKKVVSLTHVVMTEPLKLNTDPRTLHRAESNVSEATMDASMANGGGTFSPTLPGSASPNLGVPPKSPVSSAYSSNRSSDHGHSSAGPHRAPSWASSNAPSGSRGASPLGWQPQPGLPGRDPRPFGGAAGGPMLPPPPPQHPADAYRNNSSQPPSRSPSAYSMPLNGNAGGGPPGPGAPMMPPMRKDSAPGQRSPQMGGPPPGAQVQFGSPPAVPRMPDQYGSTYGYSPRGPPSQAGSSNYDGGMSPPRPDLSRQMTTFEVRPNDDSPPPSPRHAGPVTNTIIEQMKCKVFLQTNHQQWKSLGSSKLVLYLQMPGNYKQLVVNANDKNQTILISTIIMDDGVERVAKTGVAIELSDQGLRTGIIYMLQVSCTLNPLLSITVAHLTSLQLKNESGATTLYNKLLSKFGTHSLSGNT